MKANRLIHILIAFCAWQVQATEIHKLASPNGKVEVVLSQNETLITSQNCILGFLP